MNTRSSNKNLTNKIKALGFTPFPHEERWVAVSGDEGDDAMDYYGDFRGGYPWINPKLKDLAKEFDMIIEWINPGSICFFPK